MVGCRVKIIGNCRAQGQVGRVLSQLGADLFTIGNEHGHFVGYATGADLLMLDNPGGVNQYGGPYDGKGSEQQAAAHGASESAMKAGARTRERGHLTNKGISKAREVMDRVKGGTATPEDHDLLEAFHESQSEALTRDVRTDPKMGWNSTIAEEGGRLHRAAAHANRVAAAAMRGGPEPKPHIERFREGEPSTSDVDWKRPGKIEYVKQ